MNRPRVFISAVTGELRGARRRVAEILTRKGYEPVFQDIFGTEPGDLRPMLREKIESCHGLIQIVGDAYGAGPPAPDADFGRCSYTQYEFLLARQFEKKTWLLIAGPDCARDTPPAQLDLPADPAHPDPAGWQRERQELQRAYRQRPEFANHLFHKAENDLALDLAIERLGDELAGLRKEFRDWQRTVLRLAAAIMLLTSIVLGAVWWVKKGQDKGFTALRDGPKITTAGIRKQILQGSERKRDRDLAEAEGKPSIEREKLREAALAAHESRIARIDELALSFAEIEGRADATAVFREMTRILEQEGVDFALAYVAEQKGGILERIKKRKETEWEQTRAELRPLLSAARLQEAAGQSVAARASYRQLLDLEPAWPDALRRFAWFLRDQSVQAERHGTLLDAVVDAEEAHTLATRLHTAAPPSPTAQRLLSSTYVQMGAVLIKRGQEGDADKVLNHFTRGLELFDKLLAANPGSAEAARDVSVSLVRLGAFFAERGQAGDAEKALGYYTRSLDIADQLVNANPGSAQATRDVSVSLEKLGDFLAKRGQAGDAEKALGCFTRSLDLREALLKANPGSAQAARDVSASLERLGDFLATRRQAGDAEKALGHYTRSLDLREALLKANPGSAQAALAVSLGLARMGDFLARRGQAGDAEKVLGYYIRSNETLEALLKANPGSAEAARDVSVSLERLGDFLAKRGQAGDAEKALSYYTRCNETLEVLLKANPGSAEASRDVSVTLNKLGDFLVSRGQAGDADKALGYYTRSLEMKETLLKANPGSARAARDVALSLERLGDFLAKRGQKEDAGKALGCFTRSLDLREALLKANPVSAQAARDVSVSLDKLGGFLAKRGQAGDADKALGCYTRCNETLEALLKANPGSAQAARDVSVSLDKLGDFLATRGQAGNADKVLGYYTRSLDLREAVLNANLGSAQAARDMSVSLNKLGGFLATRGQAGDAEKALGYFTRSLEIDESLQKANPGSAQAARDVSLSLERLGGILAKRGQAGDAEKALGYLTRSFDLREDLLTANPGSAEAARDVSMSLYRLGGFLAKRGQAGDAEKALGYYTRYNEISEALLKANPGSAQAARDVSVGLERLGSIFAKRGQAGDAEKALGYYTRSLDLADGLLKANPGSASAARDVWLSCDRIARHAERTGKGDAMQWWRRAYDILAGMKEKGQFISPADLQILEQLRKKVGK